MDCNKEQKYLSGNYLNTRVICKLKQIVCGMCEYNPNETHVRHMHLVGDGYLNDCLKISRSKFLTRKRWRNCAQNMLFLAMSASVGTSINLRH